MSDAIPDVIFLFEGIAWLKWLVGCFFFLLGLFMGWWKWHYKHQGRDGETKGAKLSLRREKDTDEPGGEAELKIGEFGPTYGSEPDQIDDLQKIKGIGKALRAKLYSLGIYEFNQIANWSESEVAAISKKLHLANQIETDKWQDQAKSLKK